MWSPCERSGDPEDKGSAATGIELPTNNTITIIVTRAIMPYFFRAIFPPPFLDSFYKKA
jgi:hypothetical protein